MSIQVQGCGETGLYTLQDASYTATLWFTLVQGAASLAHDITHSISLLSSFVLRAYKDSSTYYLHNILRVTAHHLSKASAMPMHGSMFSCMHTTASYTQATWVRGHCINCYKIIKTSSLQRSGSTSLSSCYFTVLLNAP